MVETDLFYYDEGRKVPLRRSEDSLAVAYRGEAPPKNLAALIQGDEELSIFLSGTQLSRRNLVLYKRRAGSRVSLEKFAERLRQSGQIAYVVPVFELGGEPVVITDEIMARFQENVSMEAIQALYAAEGVEVIEEPPNLGPRTWLLRVRNPGPHGALETANRIFETGRVEYAIPNFIQILRADFPFTPNDPLFPRQWHLPLLRAPEAWDITRGNASVIVAVVDSGIEVNHPDLTARRVSGRDLFIIPPDNDPSPESRLEDHGTLIAGLIAAVGNNGTGVSGVAPECRFMPVRIFSSIPAGVDQPTFAAGVNFAWQNGAAVISNSWSLAQASPALRAAFRDAVTLGRGGRGCVVVCSAGNRNRAISEVIARAGQSVAVVNDVARLPELIPVAAHNDRNVRSGYSNFGPEVSVCAPSDGTSSARTFWQGELGSRFQEDGSTRRIVTTDRQGPSLGSNAPDEGSPDPEGISDTDYTSQFGGTSAACPQVAGVAALVLSVNPDLTQSQVRFLLEATAEKIDAGNTDPNGRYQPDGHSQFYGFGRVNAFEAVKAARASVPQDATERVFVRLRRTSGSRFVSTQVLHAVDARRRPASTPGDLFLRSGGDGFLRARIDSALGPLIEEAEVDE